MECLDILDENGNITGEVRPRTEAHVKGLWHKAIHVWIVNDNNQLLIQKRAAIKKANPNKWTASFAGHVSAGDDSIITSIREAKEELGLKLTKSDFNFICMTSTESTHNNGSLINKEHRDVYAVRQNVQLAKLTLQKEEVADAKYIDLADLKKKFKEKDPEFVIHEEEYKALFDYLDKQNN